MIRYILALIFILLFVIMIFVGIANYNSRYSDLPQKDGYSFLNQFPYELQNNETMKYSSIFRVIAALFGASFIVFGVYLFMFKDMYNVIKIMHDYVLGILFIIDGVSMFSIFTLTLKKYRPHLIMTSLLFASTITLFAYLGFFVFVDPREIYNITLGIISFVIAAALLVSLIVTPLKKWMYLEKEEVDGRITYHRKRISILPFMEWLFILVNVLLVVLLIIF